MHNGFNADELSHLVKNGYYQQGRQLVDQLGGIQIIANKLNTDLENGISTRDGLQHRIELYGINKEPERVLSMYWNTLLDRTVVSVIVCSIVSVIIGVSLPSDYPSQSIGWIEGTCTIGTLLLICVVRSVITHYMDVVDHEKQISRTVRVIRDGMKKAIYEYDVLVGDIILLSAGDRIPADCLFVSGHHCVVDESSITGDPPPRDKDANDPLLISGCTVIEGEARCMVICVGIHSQWGQIMAILDPERESTRIQEKFEEISSVTGFRAAIFVVIGLTVMWSVQHFAIGQHSWKWSDVGIFLRFVNTAVSVWIMAEGLPFAYTFCLAFSVKKMRENNILVRSMEACENLARVTCICADKAGVLTLNKFTVTALWLGGTEVTQLPIRRDFVSQNFFDTLHESIAVNTMADLDTSDPSNYQHIGNQTECALLELSRIHGIDFRQFRGHAKVLHRIPFTARTKRMSTIISKGAFNRLYCKGSLEAVLAVCDKMMLADGTTQALDAKQVLAEIETKWHDMGLRTVAMASTDEVDSENLDLEKHLTLIAICGMEDPIRSEVPQAVIACQNAGINVKMFTGDSMIIAKSAAKRCHVLTDRGVAVQGSDIRQMSEQEIRENITNICLVARCSSDSKFYAVQQLKELGEVVLVTGDGCGDAPGLKIADVGIGLGKRGTDVAKSASDVIILDDNFTSIEKAILWGRHVVERSQHLQKLFIVIGIFTLMLLFLGELAEEGFPLAPVYVLWNALLLYGIATYWVTKQPSPKLMKKSPFLSSTPSSDSDLTPLM